MLLFLFLSVVSCCFPKAYLEKKKTKQTQNNGVSGVSVFNSVEVHRPTACLAATVPFAMVLSLQAPAE